MQSVVKGRVEDGGNGNWDEVGTDEKLFVTIPSTNSGLSIFEL